MDEPPVNPNCESSNPRWTTRIDPLSHPRLESFDKSAWAKRVSTKNIACSFPLFLRAERPCRDKFKPKAKKTQTTNFLPPVSRDLATRISRLFSGFQLDKNRGIGDRNGTTVRVIEYTLDDPERVGHDEKHRLVTTLLDEKSYPAETLILKYHERWELEITIDEAKTHMRSAKTLRSHRPVGVIQEVYGLLIAHFVVRKLAFDAAAKAGVSPRKISFVGTVNVLRARLPEAPRSRQRIKDWYRFVVEEISLEVLDDRRNRINPLVIKCKVSKWLKKQQKHRKLPPLKHTFEETVRLLT